MVRMFAVVGADGVVHGDEQAIARFLVPPKMLRKCNHEECYSLALDFAVIGYNMLLEIA